MSKDFMITFRKAVISDLELLKRWFQKPHVQEFWDNSPEMWQNVISYLNGNKVLYDYWIGSFEDRPFCLIITSDASESDPNAPGSGNDFLPYLEPQGKTWTIDFMIGEESYLGRGLSYQALCEFMDQTNDVEAFLIDPEISNTKAIHVYEKAGFEKVDTFLPKGGYFSGLEHVLMKKRIDKLLSHENKKCKMSAPILETSRLILRYWKQEDLLPFSIMNADKRVMEFFPKVLSLEESNALAERIQKEFKEKPYGFWAVEVKNGVPFIGFVGLHYLDPIALPVHFTPCIEIGWRLAFDHWGKGYAFEAASKVLEYAFQTLNLKEVIAYTDVNNVRSRKVMEKLKMIHNSKENFVHPRTSENSPLTNCVLYRLKNPINKLCLA